MKRRFALLVLAFALFLIGCADGGNPGDSVDPTPATTPVDSSTERGTIVSLGDGNYYYNLDYVEFEMNGQTIRCFMIEMYHGGGLSCAPLDNRGRLFDGQEG